MTGLYVNILDRLVEMGIYLDPQDAIRDSLRRNFRAYGMEPFYREAGEIKGEAEEVPEDVAPS